MFAPTRKTNLRIFTTVLIFLLPLLSADADARGRGARQSAASGRQQSPQSVERTAPSGRNDAPVSTPQAVQERPQRPDTANFQFRQKFNTDRPATDNRPQSENFGNRQLERMRPNIGKGEPRNSDNNLNPAPVRKGGDVSPQAAPIPPAVERDAGKKFRMQGDDHNRTRRTEPVNTQTTSPSGTTVTSPDIATAKTRFQQWPRTENRSRNINNRRPERGNVTLNVVGSVPATIRTQNHRFRMDRPNITMNNTFQTRTVYRTRNDFVFYDRHRFMQHRIVRPDFFFIAAFNFGPWCTYRPVFPYHHVRYIFVNPCGYWPDDYLYVRYYRYGCYPYYWYGYNPVPYQYEGDTYNYYTYNYYDSEGSLTSTSGMGPVQPTQPPASETSADQYFDDGVKAFAEDDYKTAIAKFALASRIDPDDKVLPFAYSQAFFAVQDYKAAAQVLRAALAKVEPVNEGVFYPRGLYSSDEILLKQIDELNAAANQNKSDSDIQFLLGYQWVGIGELDKASEPLNNVRHDILNGPPANALLNLLDKLQTEDNQTKTQ